MRASKSKPMYFQAVVAAAAAVVTCCLCLRPLLINAEYGTPAAQVAPAALEPPAESMSRPAAEIQATIKDLNNDKRQFQSLNGGNAATSTNHANGPQSAASGPPSVQKCTKQSIMLARQMLAHELTYINQFNSIWFNDLDKDELLEGQKHSLSNIVMSGAGASLLNSNGQPLIEIESSYFRQQQQQYSPLAAGSHSSSASHLPITIKLIRRHADRCYLSAEKRRQFTYIFGLSLGPLEHHLDIVYNLPKDIGLSQPLSWRYAQISISVPKMNYEISLRQAAPENGNILTAGCPLEIADVTYLQNAQAHSPSIQSFGLAVNNQTLLQIERLFDDYTRPTVSARLRQLLKFYLNSKTLPLGVASNS